MTACICARICIKVMADIMLNGGGQSHSELSFIDYSKSLIDSLNAYHATKYDKLEVNDFTNSVYCISYYDSMVFIENRKKDRRACGCAIIGDDKVALY